MKRNILVIIFVLCKIIANAQSHYFRHYQVENGLSNNSVYCIFQDKNSFVWFGTKDGLNRFDGYRFKVFHVDADDESLTSDQVLSLASDDRGTLWIGEQKGLFRFDAQNERLIPFIDSLPEITDLLFDKQQQLWFISDLNLYRYNFTSSKLTSFPHHELFSNTTAVCELENGDIWVSTSNGMLKKYNPASGSFSSYDLFAHSRFPASKWIEKIIAGNDGFIYIGTSSQGIKRFDLASLEYIDLLTYNDDKTAIYVRDILQVNKKEIWFATESGIFVLNTASGKFLNLKKKYLDPYSLSDNAVYALHRDREGGIWAGTYFGGINYVPNQHNFFQKYYPDYSKNSISGSAVREICEDSSGNIWVGTEDAGLNKLNTSTGEITNFKPSGTTTGITYPNIHGLLVDGNDLWIGTFEHGLDLMDIATGKVRKHYNAGPRAHDLKSNFIVCMLRTKNGEIIVGTSNSLFSYNRGSDNFNYYNIAPREVFISSLLEDHEGTIWAGTHGQGVYFFNPSTRSRGRLQNIPNNRNSITTNTINALFEDSFHNLWIATEGGGLCKLEKTRTMVSRYTVDSGLPGNFIFKVLEDNNRRLWVTTSKGLAVLDEYHKVTTVYTRANGLLNDQFNYNSGYKDALGKLYFGSVRGMVTVKPEAFDQPPVSPPVYITGLQVHNEELQIHKDSSLLRQSILFTDRIRLPYDQSSFSIDFAAISFASPEMTRYSYLMEGLDQDWTEINSNRKVYFTNLAPGSYTFRVKAAINGQFNNAEKTLVINITPPFWATPLAYLLYAIIGISLIYYMVSVYKNMLENKKKKEIYEAKIEFFTNVAHEIRTPLTLIKGPVENLREMVMALPDIRDDVVTMERNTNRLINLVNQILDFRQTETRGFSLDFTEINLNEILQETYLTFEPVARKRKLNYTIELPEERATILADAEAMIKIFSNLFSNAVNYSEGKVHIQLRASGRNKKFVTAEISNDGPLIPDDMKEKIFEPFFRLRQTAKQKGTGIGLALTKSLVELHNGEVYVKKTLVAMNTFVVRLPKPDIPEPANRPAETKNQFTQTN